MAAPDGSRTQPRTVPEVPLLDWAWIKPAKATKTRGRADLEGRERGAAYFIRTGGRNQSVSGRNLFMSGSIGSVYTNP